MVEINITEGSVLLKPSITLLIKYGYTLPYSGPDNQFLELGTKCEMNNIPIPIDTIKHIEHILTTRNIAQPLKDTILYIVLCQADWYYAMLHGEGNRYHSLMVFQELARFIEALRPKAGVDITINIDRKNTKISSVTSPIAIELIRDAISQKLKSKGFLPDNFTDYPIFNEPIDQSYALRSPLFPRGLKGELQFIFISKLHEFIRQETLLKSSKHFTSKQRELIYEVGSILEIFPPLHDATFNSENLKHIYYDGLKKIKSGSGRFSI